MGGEKSRPQSLNVSNCRQGIWHGICAQISACSWLIFKAARIFMLGYKFPARLDLLQAIFIPPPAPTLCDLAHAIKVKILLPFFFTLPQIVGICCPKKKECKLFGINLCQNFWQLVLNLVIKFVGKTCAHSVLSAAHIKARQYFPYERQDEMRHNYLELQL